jgi:hypothetical protein
MSKVIAILTVLAASSGQSRRPPLPCIQRLPAPTPHIKVINVAGCMPTAEIFNQLPVPQYGATAAGSSSAVQNGGSGNLLLFCDGALPPEATALDYVELEYSAPNVTPYQNAWVVSWADAEILGPDGTPSSMSYQVGVCPAPAPAPAHAGAQAVSICQALSSQPFSTDGGVFAGLDAYGQVLNYTVHFVVVIPPTAAGSPPILAYRLIVHYEAP